MNKINAILGITALFFLNITGPIIIGVNVTQEKIMVMSDFEHVTKPYISDSTISETVLISEYLNQQPISAKDKGLMDSPWPMKAHDLHHTSRSPYVADDGGGLEKWRFWTESHVESSAVIDTDGIIYFGAFDYELHAMYPDGTQKWAIWIGGRIWSAPALAEDGTIYVGAWDSKLHAIHPNGTRKWKVGLGGVTTSSPAIALDGTIYVSTMGATPSGHSIVAVNPNGTIQWKYLTGDDVVSEPAIGNDGTIYCGSWDKYLYAINPDGTLKWRFKTGREILASPAIADDGTVYISSFDGWLYALNPDNGSVVWKYTDGGDEGSPAIGPDGIIYLGNSHLRAIYPNGTLRYSVDIGPNIHFGTPALSLDGILYINTANHIYAVDSEDGSVIWQKMIGNEGAYSSPIIGPDGTIYIGSGSRKRVNLYGEAILGYFHAFGPVTSNSPPDTPTIGGKPQGEAGEGHLFSFITTDAERNPVSFYVDWGDGTSTNWTMEAASQESVKLVHTWAEQGDYTIRCKARDSLGEESEWATMEISMPMSYEYPGWQWLADHFPVLTQLLKLLTQIN